MAVDTVSRSTVPVEHVKGLKLGAGQSLGGNKLGVYYAPGTFAGNKNSPPEAFVAQGNARTPTVIHEIGHHVSHEVEATEHSGYDTGRLRGQEEGFAENYAETHFRDRRGRPQRRNNPAANWAVREDKADQREDFARSFNRKRKESPLEPKHDWNSLAARGLPANHVEGQLPLLDKITTRDYGPGGRWSSAVPKDVVTWQHIPELFNDRR